MDELGAGPRISPDYQRSVPGQFPGNTAFACLFLFVMTCVVFWQACHHEFVVWDDNGYVTDRPEVLQGISGSGLLWAATANVEGNWHPVTMISLQLDAQLFGTGPEGFHRTAVLLHALNAVMVFLMLRLLTGCHGKSLVVAAIFAVHPQRVESVAWISERKDLLSGFFFCAVVLAYLKYVTAPSLLRYLVVALLFSLGLASKAMLVTLPCVLLLLDFWPLCRLKQNDPEQMPAATRLILEKLPLFILGGAFSLITMLSQHLAINSLEEVSLSNRIGNAVCGTAAYIFQTLCPIRLSPFYPLQNYSAVTVATALSIFGVGTVLAVRYRRRQPAVLVGWLWFLGMLVPVSGLVQVGAQARADRYTYLPQIGLLMAVVWGLYGVFSGFHRRTSVLRGLAAAAILGCALAAMKQTVIWQNTESLWRHAYQLFPENNMVTQYLIEAMFYDGKPEAAIQLTRTIRDQADESDSDRMVMIAMLFAKMGDHDRCLTTLTQAIRHHPRLADLYSNRAKAYAASGNWDQAVSDYRKATEIAPLNPSFRFYLAHALGKTGQRKESRELYVSSVQQWPEWPLQAATNAWKMSTSPNARERTDFWPMCLAEQAVEALGENSPAFLDMLAAACAQCSEFDRARETALRAARSAESSQQNQFAEEIRRRADLYSKQQPYREPDPAELPM